MKLLIKRIFNCPDYCIGHIYIDDSYICDCIEDTDRMLDQSMDIEDIKRIKVKDKTAIPTGKYTILMNVVSPKYSQKDYYKKICKGKVPRFDFVKGFSGVLIHCGNTASDSSGCVLIGQNKVKGKVINSKMCFEQLYHKLDVANKIGEKIICEIIRTY